MVCLTDFTATLSSFDMTTVTAHKAEMLCEMKMFFIRYMQTLISNIILNDWIKLDPNKAVPLLQNNLHQSGG